jgi:hypothetical protein
MYPVYGNHVSSINSLVKKAYAKVTLTNETVNQQLNVLVRTKFVNRSVHPYLNYSTDDVTANVSVSLDEIKFNQTIDHSGASILCYGRQDPGTTSLSDVPLRTDNCGNMSIVGYRSNATSVVQNDVRPVIIGGYSNDNTIRTIATDTSGHVKIISGEATGLAVKPGTDAVFNVSGGSTGLTVTPASGAVFNVSGGSTGLTVVPASGAAFNVSGDLMGLAVKPGTNAVFNVSGDLMGLSVKPGTNAVFNVSGGSTGLLVKYNAANFSNTLQGYVNGVDNFQRVGTGNVNAIYSINLFNSSNATYYVKFYSIPGNTDNNTETNVIPILNYIVTNFTARDIVFPHGIQVEGKPLYILVSTQFGQVESDNIANTPVQITVSYV